MFRIWIAPVVVQQVVDSPIELGIAIEQLNDKGRVNQETKD